MRTVRAITNSDYRAHFAPLFAKLGILDIFQINSLQIAKFMFYYHNQLLPPMFLNLFPSSSQVMTQDQPVVIDHTTAVQTLSSLRYFIKVLKFVILSQYPSLVQQPFLFERKR